MSGTSSQSRTMAISIPKTSIYPSLLLSISSSVSISHPIRLAPVLSPLGHSLIPSAHIQVPPSSAENPHSSYLCLHPLTLPPRIHRPPLPPALRLNPYILSPPCSAPIQSLHPAAPSFPPLCVFFRGGSSESLLMSIHHSLIAWDVCIPFKNAAHDTHHFVSHPSTCPKSVV